MSFHLAFHILALMLICNAAAADEARPAAPNVILFLTDDQGWTGTSVRMDKERQDSRSDFYRTPALDGLAKQGTRFSNAYAPHPNCTSTRMSIQTGKSPARLGSTDLMEVVPDSPDFISLFYQLYYTDKPMNVPVPISDLPGDETTIAEFIKKHRPAYTTAHFGKWHMGGGGPGEHGYDQHDGNTTNREGKVADPDPKRMISLTNRSLRFIEEQATAKKPFFLQISHYAVHDPVLALAKTIDATGSRPVGEIHTNVGYAAMTENLDESLAALLAKLEELGIDDDTYILYASDNGGEILRDLTLNTPLARGKTHTWEGGVRVPMIVRGPGIEANAQVDAPAIGWDFFPTVVDWIGVDAALPENIDGGSLVPALENPAQNTVDRATPELIWYYPHYRDSKGIRPQAAIRVGDFKLLKFYEDGQLLLFDLTDDIGESKDLSASMPDLALGLESKLEAYLTSVGAKRPTRNASYDPAKDLGRKWAEDR